MAETTSTHRKAVIGNSSNFWLHSTRTSRFDLTHPATPDSAATSKVQGRLDLTTTTTPITVDPAKTALVIIDMQNFFLSESFGRQQGAGHAAARNLIDYAIPAARQAGIRIIWLNWGLTDEDIDNMPPAVKRAFGFEAVVDEADGAIKATTEQQASGGPAGPDPFRERTDGTGVGVDKDGSPRHQGGHVLVENGKDGRIYKGLGSRCGIVKLPSGETVDAGRLLMRDQWNSALWPPLDAIYDEGSRLSTKPDVWLHKNRMSGMWGASTPCQDFLEKEGIRTLLFTGVNTDQCVSGTFTDSFSKGYDCVMLNDGCGTTSPSFSQECIEFNAAKTWGFVMSCENLAKGVEEMAK